jgi:hypothetical protein
MTAIVKGLVEPRCRWGSSRSRSAAAQCCGRSNGTCESDNGEAEPFKQRRALIVIADFHSYRRSWEAAGLLNSQHGAEPMTPDAKLEFLAGQVHALIGFCVAIIDDHHDIARLTKQIDRFEQLILAHIESTLVAEIYLDGARDVMDRLKKAVAMAQERQAVQNRDRG